MKRIIILALAASALLAAGRGAAARVGVQQQTVAVAQDAKEAPKFLLVWRDRAISMQGPRWIREVMPFDTEEEAIAFLTKKEIDEERFVGLWKLGEPLNLKASTKEETVQQKRTTREWKKKPIGALRPNKPSGLAWGCNCIGYSGPAQGVEIDFGPYTGHQGHAQAR